MSSFLGIRKVKGGELTGEEKSEILKHWQAAEKRFIRKRKAEGVDAHVFLKKSEKLWSSFRAEACVPNSNLQALIWRTLQCHCQTVLLWRSTRRTLNSRKSCSHIKLSIHMDWRRFMKNGIVSLKPNKIWTAELDSFVCSLALWIWWGHCRWKKSEVYCSFLVFIEMK